MAKVNCGPASKNDTDFDWDFFVITRNVDAAKLRGICWWATADGKKAFMDFEGIRGNLNAGAVVPSATLDAIAIEWLQERGYTVKKG